MAPRARPRDVKMVAPGGGGKRRTAVGGDKGAERGRRPHERAVLAVALFVVDPFAVDQYAHDRHSSVSRTLEFSAAGIARRVAGYKRRGMASR